VPGARFFEYEIALRHGPAVAFWAESLADLTGPSYTVKVWQPVGSTTADPPFAAFTEPGLIFEL
jgi:hypothetical protein